MVVTLQVISSTSVTATEVWSTASSIMVGTTPVCLQPHDWIGVSSRSAGWAAFIHMKSSKGAPGSMHRLAILYMEVAAGADLCACGRSGRALPLYCINPTCIVVFYCNSLAHSLSHDFFLDVGDCLPTLKFMCHGIFNLQLQSIASYNSCIAEIKIVS